MLFVDRSFPTVALANGERSPSRYIGVEGRMLFVYKDRSSASANTSSCLQTYKLKGASAKASTADAGAIALTLASGEVVTMFCDSAADCVAAVVTINRAAQSAGYDDLLDA